MMNTIEPPKVVTREEWIVARRRHLAREKELMRMKDQLSADRRALPWVKVEKDYVFDGPDGKETLSDLFAGRSQLIVYHFMFGPGWKEGCPGCSFVSDHLDGPNLHIAHHDVTLLAVSRAPWREFMPFKQRMGWKFKWVSSAGSDFNYDYHVTSTVEEQARGETYYNYTQTPTEGDEHHGLSVFHKNEAGEIFHTYSTYARGCEVLVGAYSLLDLTPKGRNEKSVMDWMRHHDRYEDAANAPTACTSTGASSKACGCHSAEDAA